MITNSLTLISDAIKIALDKVSSYDDKQEKLQKIYKQFQGNINELKVKELLYIKDQMHMNIHTSIELYSRGYKDCEYELDKIDVYEKFKSIVMSRLQVLSPHCQEIEM